MQIMQIDRLLRVAACDEVVARDGRNNAARNEEDPEPGMQRLSSCLVPLSYLFFGNTA